MRVSTPNLFSTKTEMVCLITCLVSPDDLLLRAPNMPAKSKTRVPQFLHTGTAGDLRATLTRSTGRVSLLRLRERPALRSKISSARTVTKARGRVNGIFWGIVQSCGQSQAPPGGRRPPRSASTCKEDAHFRHRHP